MSHPTYLVPYPFACTLQDPQSSSDNPTPVGGGAPSGTAPSSGAPATGGQAPGIPGTVAEGEANKKAPPAQGPCANETMMYMMPLMLVLMYFMIFRPEQKRKKEQAAMMAAMRVGERVVMVGGMHGVINSLDDTTVTIRAGDSNITFDRSSVARIVTDSATSGAAK